MNNVKKGPQQFIELNGVLVPAEEYAERKKALNGDVQIVSERHISIKDFLRQAELDAKQAKAKVQSKEVKVEEVQEEVEVEAEEEKKVPAKKGKWNTK